MVSGSSDLPHESLQIKQDDKFFSRLLSKESYLTNPSFRVYYGVASGSVPFLWESQPGTPKNTIPTTTLPPLTPPPSYHFHPKKHTKKPSKPNLITTILPRLTRRKSPASASPLNSLSSSSVSWSSSFSPTSSTGLHWRSKSSPKSSFSSRGEDSDCEDNSPTSTLCFGVRHRSIAGHRGCHSVVTMKNALRSIVGHGSSQGTAS